MDLASYFIPRELERVRSEFNREIVVVKSEGKVRLLVDGLTQSGRYIDKIWGKGVGYLKGNGFMPESCLILGLGGGTVAGLVSEAWSGLSIVGVEIDPMMVKLGREYLKLGGIPKLEVVIRNAMDFTNSTHRKYDLVLVDAYKGVVCEAELQNVDRLMRVLSPGGVIVFNLLFHTKELKREAGDFVEGIKKWNIKLLRESANLLVVITKKKQQDNSLFSRIGVTR